MSELMQVPPVGIILVLYHPNLSIVTELIDGLLLQRVPVVVIDNTPGTINPEKRIVLEERPIQYLHLGENIGIAQAQNEGASYLFAKGCEAVILVDQDTILPADYCSQLWDRYQVLRGQSFSPIAAVGPTYIDRKSQLQSRGLRFTWWGGVRRFILSSAHEPVLVDFVIASGSLIPKQAWEQVGGMWELLFIYWVDVEWGLRAKAFGYQSYVIPQLCISHSVGQASKKIGWRLFSWHEESAQYYILRNPFLLSRRSFIPRFLRAGLLAGVFLKYLPIYILLSSNRPRTFINAYQAIKDGICQRGGRRAS